MRHKIGLVTAFALVAAALALSAAPAVAQVPPEVTITFKLTLNGSVPAEDGFDVTWAENGMHICLPCAGGGHTYIVTSPWPLGPAPVTFVFVRSNAANGPNRIQTQRFGQRIVVPTRDRTVAAFFTYGTTKASVPTPSTGAATSFGFGAGLVGLGVTALLLAAHHGRRTRRRVSLPMTPARPPSAGSGRP